MKIAVVMGLLAASLVLFTLSEAELQMPALPVPMRALPVPMLGFNAVEVHEGEGFSGRHLDQVLARIQGIGSNVVAFVVPLRLTALTSNEFYTYAPTTASTLRNMVSKAHARQLKVILIPHIWVDGGQWRGDLQREGEAAEAFFDAYGRRITNLARDAESAGVDAFSFAVELKGLSADARHDAHFSGLIVELRRLFKGVLTYSANWNEIAQVRFWRQLDFISVNGFFPLTDSTAPSDAELQQGAQAMMRGLDKVAEQHQRPILFIELGYKACTDNTREPWVWPSTNAQPALDENAQARAYRVVFGELKKFPRLVGALLWVVPVAADEKSAVGFEPFWGFNPLGKLAEQHVKDFALWVSQRREIGREIVPFGSSSAPQRRP